MKYKMIPNNDKNDWTKTLAYFTNIYAMRKAYSEDCAAESGFASAVNVTHIALPESIRNSSLKLNRGGPMGIINPTQEEEATA